MPLRKIIWMASAPLILSGCATICGGSKYNAHILVPDHPTAQVVYNGEVVGTGSALIMVKRKDANKLSFTVRGKGCAPQTYTYAKRTFRGWAFAGTLVTWTAYAAGIYFPWGFGVDLATGALWKPNVRKDNIVKVNSKNFTYLIKYTGCPTQQEQDDVDNTKVDIVYLKNGSILKGKLIGADSPTQVKIQMKDGSIFVFKLDEVLKIE